MKQRHLLGLPLLLGSLTGAGVAFGQPADLQAALDALWATTLLAMAGLGFLVPEWLLHPDHERPGDLHPGSGNVNHVFAAGAAVIAAGVACAAVVSLGMPDFTTSQPLLMYGLLCGLAAAAVAMTAAVSAPWLALEVWGRGSAGRQLAIAILQTPVLSAIAVGGGGLLLLIGALALMEPDRLTGGWHSDLPVPRSTWVGVGVCAAPLVVALIQSTSMWIRNFRRHRIVTRTARMMLGSAAGRTVAFDAVTNTDNLTVLERVVVVTLTRRLPPVRGVLMVLGLVCLGIGVAAARPAVDRGVVMLPILWAVVLTSWPRRVDQLVDEVVAMSRLHPCPPGATSPGPHRRARMWLAARFYPGVLVPLPALGWNAAVGALGILLAVTTALILIPAGRAPVRLLSTALFVGALTWSVFPVLNPW